MKHIIPAIAASLVAAATAAAQGPPPPKNFVGAPMSGANEVGQAFAVAGYGLTGTGKISTAKPARSWLAHGQTPSGTSAPAPAASITQITQNAGCSGDGGGRAPRDEGRPDLSIDFQISPARPCRGAPSAVVTHTLRRRAAAALASDG